MSDNSANSKRIAKNTLLLYVRMILLMLISLYTSRIILNTLGVSDFGIYNAVGGVVAMFSILSSSLSTAISRYITFELGRKDYDRLKKIFSTAINVQCLMAIAIIIIIEIVGIWFLNYKMNIPQERLDAANWVMHCSILVFAVNLISVPYNACIIAHEKMGAFAYISIVEATLKLLIVYALYVSPFDKLKTYAVLMLCVALIIRGIYGIYCKRHFIECTYHFVNDKALLKEMTSFAGWSFFGNAAWMFNTQGVNILINMFFGVTFNAARGIATQVESAVMQFVNNFMTALNPQITKSYAAGDLDYMHTIICRGAKYSFFLMFLFALPICLEAREVLSLWLKIVPPYSIIFVRLTFLTAAATMLGNTLYTAQFATGNIKKYQITITIWGLWVFPLTWLAYKCGMPAATTYIIYFMIYFILIFVRIRLVKDLIKMPWEMYIKNVLFRVAIVVMTSSILPVFIVASMKEGVLRLILTCIASLACTAASIYYLGMAMNERATAIQLIKSKLKSK